MAKSLNEFGGFLRLSQIYFWFNPLLALFLFGASYAMVFHRYNPENLDATHRVVAGLFDMIGAGVTGYLYYWIVKIIKVRSTDTPKKSLKLS